MNDEVLGLPWQSGEVEQGMTQQPAGTKLKPKVRASNWRQKTILLVDGNARSRDSRAKMLRKLGAVVVCASTHETAISRFGSGLYNLVLIDLKHDIDTAEQLANEIRTSNPRQLVAFLVGSPLFVAKSLRRDPDELKRVPALASITPQEKPQVKTNTPGPEIFDFGQKIREAESKVVA